jgi:hypothetical protein
MKKLLLSLFLFLGMLSYGQTIYSWVPNVNPGWVSNDGELKWRNCNYVTTNCNGNYSVNLDTRYTSPTINTICSNASTVNISFDIVGNSEYGYDFLFLEYSLNGGVWINLYGPNIGWTGNFATTTNVSNVLSSSSNFRFRFRFTSDGNIIKSGYKISNFKIVCNVALPIELVSFEGYNKNSNNNLIWSTSSEQNNDYFTIERSVNGINWVIVNTIKGNGNSTSTIEYSLVDNSYDNVINYYQLKQTDYDGKFELFEKMVVIDNRIIEKKIIKTVNLLGQEVDENYGGVVIEVYEDNTTSKKIQ